MKTAIVRTSALSVALAMLIVPAAQATSAANQSTVDNGVAYLKTQQAVTGKIGTSNADTGWSAVALDAAGISLSAVKASGGVSVLAYLEANAPAATDKATDWERSIIAITADNQNPYNFGGVNYVSKLEGFVSAGQIGLTAASNDDYFGLMALLSAHVSSSNPIVASELSYVLAAQQTDGGFSYSTDPTVTSDTNDTAAAIMALKAAQNAGLGSAAVTSALAKADAYNLGTQNSDGGFPYDPLTPIAWGGPVSDGSSTSWVLMGLSALGEGNSAAGLKAQAYLRTLPLADGSFPSFDPTKGDVFDSAPAITALAGGTYPLHTYEGTVPVATATPTPTPTPASGTVLGASTGSGAGATSPSVLPAVGELSNHTLLGLGFLIAVASGLAVRYRQLRLASAKK